MPNTYVNWEMISLQAIVSSKVRIGLEEKGKETISLQL